MHKRILPLFAALSLLACGSAESDLEGTWGLAPESIDEMANGVPASARAAAKERASQMSMTFKDGKCTATVPGMGSKEGTYVVKSADGNKLTVETEMDGKKETMVLEMDGDAFSTTMQGNAVKFVRSD